MELYSKDEIKASVDGIYEMSERFGVSQDEVVCACWLIAKDLVATRLKRDLEDRKE